MHRIRTWARTKAHGPAPLIAEGRRSGTGSRPAGQNDIALRTSRDGAAATGDAAADTSAAAASEKPAAPEKRNLLVTFFYTVKGILFSSPVNILLVFVPVGIAVKAVNMSAGIIFAMNAIAIVPLAGLLSHATESVAKRLGDTVGALMNVTFGNAVELIILIALVKDEIRIVQASLLGSILANLLLILGMCFLFGGLRFREQIYNSTVTQMSACLLSLSVSSLLLPTAFHASFSNGDDADDKVLIVSRGTSVILLIVYFLYLAFQLNSHAYLYESTPRHIIEAEAVPGPAANYFNSSSSSDTSSDSSSSSSSDSDSSGKAARIKRAIKGKRRRKQSAVIADPEDVAASAAPVSKETAAEASQAPDVDASAVADDEGEGAERRKHRKKKHKKRGSRKSSRDGDEGGDETVVAAAATTAGGGGGGLAEGQRVDFAVAPELEAQASTTTPVRPKPFTLRSLRPNMPHNVFMAAAPPPNPLTGQAQQHPHQHQHQHHQHQHQLHSRSQAGALRRTTSMPADHRSYRQQPNMIPPIVPIVVNSTPKTHAADEEEDEEPEISRTSAILLLLVSTGLVALCAEFMVDSINEIVPKGNDNSGLSEAFIGLILLPIVGNAAEHVTAVTVALKNKMDLAIGVAVGSSIQIALFVTPLVVILGWIMKKEMSLFFTLFETVSLFVSAFIVNFLVLDGRSNYLEGALLCSAYIIIAVAAAFYPPAGAANSLGGGTNATDEGAKLLVRGMANLVGL